MPTIPIYQADAFTREVFRGNPAAFCPLREWLPDDRLQQIAMENNLSDTAFTIPEGNDYHIRWFTPAMEVDLCGHATLATAAVYFTELGYDRDEIRFNSRSGWLTVRREADGRLTLDFPADPPVPVSDPPACLFDGLGIAPVPVWKGRFDYLLELADETRVLALKPDFHVLSGVPSRGVVVTAKGDGSDFVSRGFFPQSGIDEDPVTGSAHCLLMPYWASRSGRDHLSAIQVSARRGWLDCRLMGDRVRMSGNAALYLKGEIRF